MRRIVALVAFCGASVLAGGIAEAAPADWSATQTHAPRLKPELPLTPTAAYLPLQVVVTLNYRNEALLKDFLRGQSQPGDPRYGQVFEPAAFRDQFAPSAAQAQPVVDYLKAQGFQHVSLSPTRMQVSAEATAGQAEAAFNTHIADVQVGGKLLRTITQDAQVPAALGSVVQSVLGLASIDAMRTHAQHRLPVGATPNAGTPALNFSYDAAQFQKVYNAADTPTGSNTVVAIASAGDDLSQVVKDLRQYETQKKIPQVPVQIVNVAATGTDTTGDGEWDLDSQSSTGIGGEFKKLIFYNTTSLGTANLQLIYDRFVSDKQALIGNMSYGGCEAINVALGGTTAADARFMQAQAQGQTWFASSGDAGASCSVAVNVGLPDSGPPDVEYPASSSYVIAVGGTTLTSDADYNYVMEISWTGGGGGTSTFEKAPSWQSGIVPTASAGFRALPDIAMDADPNTGAELIENGSQAFIGGTSLSSPLSAGVFARMQTAHCNKLTFPAPYFYALAKGVTNGGPSVTGFHDVIAGSNGGYEATPGWDYDTGVGTFDIKVVNGLLPKVSCGTTTTAVDIAPVAVLAADKTTGTAPLSVTFNGASSTDADGAADIASYTLDFGDASTPVMQTGAAFAAHTYAAGHWVAQLTVTDKAGMTGVSTLAVDATAAASAPVSTVSCKLPGVKVATDPAGDNTDSAVAAHDVIAVYMAEPYEAGKPDRLVVSLDLTSLATVPPNTLYYVYFNAPDGVQHFVNYDNSNPTAVTFNYGHVTTAAGGTGQNTTDGTADADSKLDTANNRVTWYLTKTKIPALSGTAALTAVSGEARVLVGVAGSGLVTRVDANNVAGMYTEATNAICKPNTPPVAAITASFTSGVAPVTVEFNGAGSTDADGDALTNYAFSFSDGQSLSSTTGKVSRTFDTAGTYTASLKVTDSRNADSSNAPSVTVTVTAPPAASTPPPASSTMPTLTASPTVSTSTTTSSTESGRFGGGAFNPALALLLMLAAGLRRTLRKS